MPQGHVHIQASSTTRSSPSPTSTARSISWGSAGVAGFKGSRKSTPYAAALSRRRRRQAAMEHGMRQVEVFVKGPGAGREQAIRSLQAAASRSAPSPTSRPSRTTAAARPSGAASRRPRTMARYTGPVCRLCRREGMKLFLKGARCYTKKCAFERRPTPPGQHGVRRRKVGRVRPPAAREAEGPPRSTASSSASSATTSSTPRPPRRDRREPAPLARAAPRQRRLPDGLRRQPRRRRASSSATATSPSTAADRHPVVPGQAGRQGRGPRDQPRAASTFKIAKETLRDAPGAGWLTVDADKLAGSVTRCPAATRCRSISTSSSWSSTTRGNRTS